jgi:hypothetical protein
MFRVLVLAAVLLGCSSLHGMHVTLYGGVDDPDVLVWDSRDRLISYGVGSIDTRNFLLPHAMLNRPGTRAIVQTCIKGIVHSKFSGGTEDAVGVLIVSGKYKGRYGWVASADVHGRGVTETSEAW